jgi:hypothetical protein
MPWASAVSNLLANYQNQAANYYNQAIQNSQKYNAYAALLNGG